MLLLWAARGHTCPCVQFDILAFLRKPPAFHRSKLLLKSVLLLFRKHLLLVGVNDWACWKCNNEPLDYLTHNSSTKQFFFTSI